MAFRPQEALYKDIMQGNRIKRIQNTVLYDHKEFEKSVSLA